MLPCKSFNKLKFYRHGKKHTIYPTAVNYRANIYALKSVGCTHIVVTTACGSLREEMVPGDMVILDQFIDRSVSYYKAKQIIPVVPVT